MAATSASTPDVGSARPSKLQPEVRGSRVRQNGFRHLRPSEFAKLFGSNRVSIGRSGGTYRRWVLGGIRWRVDPSQQAPREVGSALFNTRRVEAAWSSLAKVCIDDFRANHSLTDYGRVVGNSDIWAARRRSVRVAGDSPSFAP